MMDSIALLLAAAAYEIGLFAAAVFLLFGLDDLMVDTLYLSGTANPLRPAPHPATPLHRDVAMYVPAWAEGEVIGAMLAHCTSTWTHARLAIYVGVYPNDFSTMRAVADWAAKDARVRMVVNARSGPTTKGDCLNSIWRRHRRDRDSGLVNSGTILLHDAEDVVDPLALVAMDEGLLTADYVQLPVIPLMGQGHHWIRRHYCDEFAEAHGKELPVRSALGAPMPTAGVGCAFRVEALERIGGANGPFPADSLTEDYELGLRLGIEGARGELIRFDRGGGRLVASRGYFPERIDTAVRQKTRWLRGNALDGWVRTGWSRPANASVVRSLVSWWMLWRDRRALLAAAAIFAGYLAMLLGLSSLALGAVAGVLVRIGGSLAWVLASLNLVLLLWRLALRGWFTGRLYGWQQGVMAILRQPVSNVILVMTAWRAMLGHWRGLRGQPLVWDKTSHHFPEPGSLATASLAEGGR